MILSDHRVTYYTPFEHYRDLDILRVSLIGLSISAIVFTFMLSVRRWRESRYSASWFLWGIMLTLFADSFGNYVSLGRPPTWVLPLRILFLMVIFVANAEVLREYAKPGGMWEKREENTL